MLNLMKIQDDIITSGNKASKIKMKGILVKT